MTMVIIMLLVALVSFALGHAYATSNEAQLRQLELEEAEDARVFNEYVATDVTTTLQLFQAKRPHLHVVHDGNVDAHFDRLCRLGIVEES